MEDSLVRNIGRWVCSINQILVLSEDPQGSDFVKTQRSIIIKQVHSEALTPDDIKSIILSGPPKSKTILHNTTLLKKSLYELCVEYFFKYGKCKRRKVKQKRGSLQEGVKKLRRELSQGHINQ